MAKTISFAWVGGLSYCPKCKVVYYQKDECDCDEKTI